MTILVNSKDTLHLRLYMSLFLQSVITCLCYNEMLVSTIPNAPTCAPGTVSFQKARNRDTQQYL